MSCINPTGDGSAVVLTISPDQARVLRPIFEMVRDGIREELATQPDDALREPARLRREEEAWVSLLAALAGEAVVPGPELSRVATELAESIDEANEYERVVAEHEALRALQSQLGRFPAEGS